MLKWELVEEYKEVLYEKAKPGYSAVARVTLNRPEKDECAGQTIT